MTQRRSECFRKGEPDSHVESANMVCKFVESLPQYFTMQRHGILFPDKYYHEYDIIIWKLTTEGTVYTHFVEIGDIGDDSKHNPDHPEILINDGIAKAHVENYYPDSLYIKINKDDAYYRDWVLKKKLNLVK